MKDRVRRAQRIPVFAGWLMWAVALLGWTYLLVAPLDWLPSWLRFKGTGPSSLLAWSKIGHFSAYAALAGIVWFMPVGRVGRIALWLILSAHAFLSEFAQTYVPSRSGDWMDVGIDHAGIAAGFLVGGLIAHQWKSPAVQPHQDAG